MIGIIVNPHSRRNKRTKCAAVREFSEIGGEDVDVRATATLDELDACLAEFRDRNYECVAISGGDGTIHHVLSRLVAVYGTALPKVLLLSDGTMNNIATSIRMNRNSRTLLRRTVALMRQGENLPVTHVDLMKIDDRYCALFGCGLVSTFLNEAYKGNKGFVQNLRVIRKAVIEAFRSVRGREGLELLAPFHCTISGDGQKAELDDVTVLLAGTVECIGMGFRPLSRAREQEGTFHLLVNGMHPLRLLRSLNAMRRGKAVRHRQHIDLVVRSLEIVAPEPFEYTMDGDMYQSSGVLLVQAGPVVPFVVI